MFKLSSSPLIYISIITFVLITTTSSIGICQLRVDKVIPPSFNAAALIKYCDHPVGQEYGIPEINFELAELTNDDIKIPVSLSYHSIGVKVEEEATWVGLGWYLNAGGFITRIIRGENDFGISEFDDLGNAKGYPFEHIKPCFDDCNENENADFHKKVCAGEIDSDPDIFFYDILGVKGKFLLTPDHDPDSESIEIKIVTPKKMTARFYIKKNYWKVTDEEGFQFTFSIREITETFENYFDYKKDSHKLHFLNEYNKATSSWYLTEIKSPKGATAIFYYDTDPDGSSGYTSNSAYHRMNINDADVWDLHYSSYCFPDAIENIQIQAENQHNDIYLSSIKCGDYKIRFTKTVQTHMVYKKNDESNEVKNKYRPETFAVLGPQKLDRIRVTKTGEEISRTNLYYGYFNDHISDESAALFQRLRLDSMVTSGDNSKNTVRFGYVREPGLPSKESHARDLWGYHNGEEDIHNITPSDFFNYSQPEKVLQDEREAKHYSLDHIKGGVLNKINFDSQKTLEFVYDHQEFYSISDEISGHFSNKMKDSNFQQHHNPYIFGGLRVDKIIETNGSDQVIKSFDYTQDGNESGELVISHYNHNHHGFGHKTSGNHTVKYGSVRVTTE